MLFRIFLTTTPEILTLATEQAQYIATVLRLTVGQAFEVVNGTPEVTVYMINDIQKKSVIAHKERTYNESNEPRIKLTLAQALVHQEKLDLIIQKATELGVSEFALYPGETSQMKFKNIEHKQERWQKIIESAVCQSRRTSLPTITIYNSLAAVIEKRPPIYYADTAAPKGIPAVSEMTLIIGPESGFSETELNLLQEKAIGFSVGTTVLRTETAAIGITARLLL
jgi:16S rRNA (uracil1498-N3)-methyltransferase